MQDRIYVRNRQGIGSSPGSSNRTPRKPRRKGASMGIQYHDNGDIYHCLDDGYACEPVAYVCQHCAWDGARGVYAEQK